MPPGHHAANYGKTIRLGRNRAWHAFTDLSICAAKTGAYPETATIKAPPAQPEAGHIRKRLRRCPLAQPNAGRIRKRLRRWLPQRSQKRVTSKNGYTGGLLQRSYTRELNRKAATPKSTECAEHRKSGPISPPAITVRHSKRVAPALPLPEPPSQYPTRRFLLWLPSPPCAALSESITPPQRPGIVAGFTTAFAAASSAAFRNLQLSRRLCACASLPWRPVAI